MPSDKIKATYTNGAFVPHVPFDLPDDTEVELTVNPADNPCFTREELHERR